MAVKCKDNPNVDKFIDYIYTPDEQITNLCTEFIELTNIDVSTAVGFNTLLRYISQHIEKIDNSDIDTMDYYFNIYSYISSTCKILPDLTSFCIMIDLSYDTMKEWKSENVRSATHSQIVKKWDTFCKSVCVASAATGNVGAIYVSKAIHGLSDNAPAAQYTQNNLYINAPVSREAIAAEFGGMLEDKTLDVVEVKEVDTR